MTTNALDQTVTIHASRATVFRFFTDSVRWARWWGAGSTIDPVVGGAVLIVYPGNVRASGVVRAIVDGERLAFSFGYDRGTPIPAGSSLVTITLSDLPSGATRLELRHEVDDAAHAAHVQGWRHQLAVFAHVAAGDVDVAPALSAWFAAWSGGDPAALAPFVTPDVRFRDANGDLAGFPALAAHLAAVARFMPGVRLEPRGAPRRGHDLALVDWVALRGDTQLMAGTNVFRFAPDARLVDVVGIAGL